jgi:glutaredoxin
MARRGVFWCGLSAVLLVTGAVSARAQGDPDVIVFYREGCHDCERMDGVLAELHEIYPSLAVRHIEETEPDGELLWPLATAYGIFPTKFPVIFVGDEAIVGVGLDKELRLRTAVSACMRDSCESPLVRLTGPRIPWRTYLIVGLLAVILLLIYIES